MDETYRNKIAVELQKHSHPLNVKWTDLYNIVNGLVAPTKVNVQDALHIGSTQSEKFADLLSGAFPSKIERNVKTMQEMKEVVIVNGRPYLTLIPYSPDCWSSVNNVAWRWQISSSTNWVMYLRLPSTSLGVWEKEIKQCSSSVLGSRSIAHLHLAWWWSTPASCCTMLSGLSLGQQAILPWASVSDWAVIGQKPKNWCCLTAITRMNQLRRSTRGWDEPEQDWRTSIWRPTPHSHAEEQSWRIQRTKVSSPASCVDIPYRITCSSLTNLIVSSPMRRRTSRSVVICWRPQLAVEKRLGSSVTTLKFSSWSSTGHGGRLSGRTSRWRSGTGRCLTYAQQ